MSPGDDVPDPRSGPRAALRWFLHSDDTTVVFVRETVSSALAVAMVGLLLFAVSGLWPPLVAVESGSMQPNLHKGDLVFVMEEDRFPPEPAYADTGVVTYDHGKEVGYTQFGSYGDVVVYEPNGAERTTPVIHRARFYVQEGENWYDEADKDYLQPGWDSCEEVPNCPAPNSGFITKGDANPLYDQVWGISRPVKEEWIRGTAEFHIPWLGWVRLVFSGQAIIPIPTVPIPTVETGIGSVGAVSAVSPGVAG